MLSVEELAAASCDIRVLNIRPSLNPSQVIGR